MHEMTSGSVSIEIRMVGMPDDDRPPFGKAVLALEDFGVSFDALDIRRHLIDALPEPGHPHAISITRADYEWGASAEGIRILLEFAGGVVASGIIWEGFRKVLARLVDRLVAGWESEGWMPHEPLTIEEAEERARWYVEATFGLDAGRLRTTARKENLQEVAFALTFEAGGTQYEVEVLDEHGLALFTWVSHDPTGDQVSES